LPHARFAILRRKGVDLESSFASVLQPIKTSNPVERVRRLRTDDDSSSPVGVEVSLKGGRTDCILSAIDGSKVHKFGEIALSGRFAFVSLHDGGLRKALLTGSRSVVAKDWEVAAERASYWGRVDAVDLAKCTITTTRELPTDGSLVGRKVYVDRRDYSRKSCFGIRSVERVGAEYVIHLDTDTLELGRGYVSTEEQPGLHELKNIVPLEKSTSCQRTNTGFFKGKPLVAGDGTTAPIMDVIAAHGKKTILVPDPLQFGKGQDLVIYEIQAGDTFEIPTTVDVTIDDTTISADCACRASLRIGEQVYLLQPGKTMARLR